MDAQVCCRICCRRPQAGDEYEWQGVGVLKDFEQWLSDQIGERGLVTTIWAPVGFTIGLLGLGAIGNLPALAFIAAALLAFEVLVLAVFLWSRYSENRRRLALRTKTLNRYATLMAKGNQTQHRYTKWDETITIGKRGDATVVRKIYVTVDDGELNWVECGMTAYAPDGVTPREKRRIRVRVRLLDDDDKPATTCDATDNWNELDGSVRHGLKIHLREPLVKGDSVALQVEWFWPGYSRGLVDGASEDFDWAFRPPTDEIKVKVVLSEKALRGRTPKVVPIGQTAMPDCDLVGKVWSAEATYATPESMKKVGFEVELARNT